MNRKIRGIALAIAKRNDFLRKIMRATYDGFRKTRYRVETADIETDERTIVFASFGGKKYSDSPKALYEYMQANSEYDDYEFIWFFKHPENFEEYFKGRHNTKILKIRTGECRFYLAKAKYWIFNFKINEYLYAKEDQIFLQCWHGTPLKRLGCDLTHFDNQLNTPEEMKNRYRREAEKFDYFISPSKYASEKFISAWDLRAIGKEDVILEEGYPRNDFLINYTEQDLRRIKTELFGEKPPEKKTILYAPTYRANQHKSGVGYVYEEHVDFDKMREALGDEYVILFRPHYFIANNFDFEQYEGFVYDVSDWEDINELFVISDILITDYSSVFFDYANLKRPIIFYMYDLEYYRDESNGFYLDIDKDLPGDIVKTVDELIEKIKSEGAKTDDEVFDERYQKFNNTYNYLDDGNASERVLHRVIG